MVLSILRFFANRRTGLAVFPTWLVVKDHVPVETDKFAAAAQQSDEEVGVVMETVQAEGKEKTAV